jgi:acetoin utilization protein AcuB
MDDMLIRDWMTTGPITIGQGASLTEARHRMEKGDIRRLLVVDSGQVLQGIITWGDVVEAWPSPFSMLEPDEIREMMSRILVEEIMSTDIVSTDPETTIAEAANLMFEHRIGALPVVDEGRTVGILSNSDLLQGLVRTISRIGRHDSGGSASA